MKCWSGYYYGSFNGAQKASVGELLHWREWESCFILLKCVLTKDIQGSSSCGLLSGLMGRVPAALQRRLFPFHRCAFTDARSVCGQQISWHFPVSFLHSPSEGFSLDKFLKNLILSWHPVFICPEQTHHLEAKTVSQFLQIYGVYGKSVLGSKAFWP